MRNVLLLMLSAFMLISCQAQKTPEPEAEWIQLFNGTDLEGWDIKFTGYPLNENYNNTFRVQDGLLTASYSEWQEFGNVFGHIFYNKPFSHYHLRVEYRFVGDQVKGGPAWAFRNNGAMLHSQSAESMTLDQDFPVSIEAQLLGGNGVDDRTTANLCTPGTHVHINGELVTDHCINSVSPTFHGDEWVTAEFIVLGDSIVYHVVGGDTVLQYTNPIIGGAPAGFALEEGSPLGSGYIALQAESHTTQFRKVELKELPH